MLFYGERAEETVGGRGAMSPLPAEPARQPLGPEGRADPPARLESDLQRTVAPGYSMRQEEG